MSEISKVAQESRRRMQVYLGMSQRMRRAPTAAEFAQQARIPVHKADGFMRRHALPRTPAGYTEGKAEAVAAVKGTPEVRMGRSFTVRQDPPEIVAHPFFIPRSECYETPRPDAPGIDAACARCGISLGHIRLQEYALCVFRDGLRAPLCRNCYERGAIFIDRKEAEATC